MTKTKFVKRYPRAVIFTRGRWGWAHLLHHPTDKPTERNIIGAQYLGITPNNYKHVTDLIDTCRSEPS